MIIDHLLTGVEVAPASIGSSFDPRTEFAIVSQDLLELGENCMRWAARSLGAKVDVIDLGLIRYPAGVGHKQHRDRERAMEYGRTRTVTFSLLLTEPGVSHTGGEFFGADGVPVDATIGELIAWEASTLHGVAPVQTGARIAVPAGVRPGDRSRRGRSPRRSQFSVLGSRGSRPG